MSLARCPEAVQGKPGLTPPRLPLYLGGSLPGRVEVDGPAFLVRRPERAVMRFPFVRLSRILCGPHVEWSAAALAAAMEQGITILFLDAAGEPLGYLYPAVCRPSGLSQLLAELADRPDAKEHYRCWLRAERMRACREWREESAAAGCPVGEDEWRRIVWRHVYQAEREDLCSVTLHPLFRDAVYAWALQQCRDAGLQPVYHTVGGDTLALANDLAGLMLLALYLRLQGLGSAVGGDEAALLTLAHRFSEATLQRGRHILGRLHKRLLELFEQWR